MPSPKPSYPAFLSTQLEELRLRLVAEFERLNEDLPASDVKDVVVASGYPKVFWREEGLGAPLDAKVLWQGAGSLEEKLGVTTDTKPLEDDDCSELVPPTHVRAIEVRTSSLKALNSSTRKEESPDLDLSGQFEYTEFRRETSPAVEVHRTRTPFRQFTDYMSSEDLCPTSNREEASVTPSATSDQLRAQTPFTPSGSNPNAKRRFSNASVSIAELAMRKEAFSNNFVIYPGSTAYSNWSSFISVLVVFSCFMTPFRFSFLEGVAFFDHVDTALDIALGLDILLTFNVAIITKDGVVTGRRPIFLAYALSLRFLIDVMATFPFDHVWPFFASGSSDTNREVASALGLLRLLRVNRLLGLFHKMQKNTHFNLLSVVVVKFVVFILLCTHTAGCVFYKLAQLRDFGESTWVASADPDLPFKNLATRYIRALFWAVGTFKAGPVSGALGPSSNLEMVWAVLAMMANICLGTYLVSNMSALLTATDVNIYNMRNQLMQLDDFATRHKLPKELQFQLMSFARFKFSTHEEGDQRLLAGLPDSYRQRINCILFEDLIKSVNIFQSCADLFLRQLYSNFTQALYMADQQLATIDGLSNSLQILAEGEVDLFHRNGSVIDRRSEGEVFTAVSFLCKAGQPYSVRTRMVCRVLALGAPAWEAACTAFPENLQHVRHNLLTMCEDKVTECMPGTPGFVTFTEAANLVRGYLVQQEELTIAMLCSAAARGDLPELKRHLVASSPNCSNYDCRTPLHLAAVHGQLDACQLLLDAQADVDPKDNFGRTPLLDACCSRQEAIAQLLHARGATLGITHRKKTTSRTSKTEEEFDSPSSPPAAELCQAAAEVDQLWYLRSLIKYGADPNLGDYDARTALHVSNSTGNRAAVEVLLGHPTINLDPRDKFGRTPLMEAVRHGHEACARLMKARGAFHGFCSNLKECDNHSIPAGQELCQAAFSNQVNYLHNLVKLCGLNVDAADYDLRTALMLASAEGNMAVAISLVQNKADVYLKDRWGHTAITEAEEHGHKDLASVLRLMGARKDSN